MAGVLRLQAVTLPVPELARVEKFYRWVLAMKAVASETTAQKRPLAWDGEDRIVLVDAGASGAEEAVTLRLPPMPPEGLAAWLDERALGSEAAGGTPSDGLTVTLRGPVEPRIDLVAPLADEGLRSGSARTGGALEIPGLLGVTTGVADPAEARSFLARLGIEPLDPEVPDGPLRIGDQQWILERREPRGIYGLAVVIAASRVIDLARTLEKLGADFRHDGHRIVALDPAGRVLLVHGLKGG